MKTLLMITALFLILLIIRHLWRQQRKPGHPAITQQTVQCAHCGLYLPKDEAIDHQGRPYCCPEHRDANHSN